MSSSNLFFVSTRSRGSESLADFDKERTRCNVLALHSLPGSAGSRLLHPSLVMYDLSGCSRPLRRPASPVSSFQQTLGWKVEDSR